MRTKSSDTYARELRAKIETKYGKYDDALDEQVITIRESERKGTKHPWHRPCDSKWHGWWQIPGGKFGISITAYNECRIPYEQQQDYTIDFD